jgi:hypothetical protein
MIAIDTIVVQDSEPVAATVDDEVVMLSVRAGAYFGLDGIGSEIWNMVREPRRVGDICRSLSEVYDVDDDTVARDVVAFLRSLLERGLVRVVDQVDNAGR